MSLPKALLLAFCLALFAPAALAQSQSKSADWWGKPADLTPMMPPPVRPFLPPNSAITSGPASSGSTYSSGPLYDPTRDQATPGLRLTIPSR